MHFSKLNVELRKYLDVELRELGCRIVNLDVELRKLGC